MSGTISGRVEPERSGTLLDALVGAVTMVLLSPVPFSPVLGGAVAGYLHRREGLRVGALAGVLAAVPVVVAVTLVVAFFVPVVAVPGDGGVGLGPLAGVGALGFAALLLVTLYTAGLGALGGYLGVLLFERRAADRP